VRTFDRPPGHPSADGSQPPNVDNIEDFSDTNTMMYRRPEPDADGHAVPLQPHEGSDLTAARPPKKHAEG